MLHASCCARTCRTRASVRIDASRAAAHPGRASRADRTRPADPVRHPAGQPGRARALPDERVRFVGDPVAAVVARDELTAFEALDLDRRRVRAAAARSPIRGEPGARRAAHPRLRRRRQRPQDGRRSRSATSTTALARGRPRLRGHVLLSRATRTCRSSSTPRSRRSIRDGKLVLWSSTQTPHYVHRALAKVLEHAGRAHPRHRDAERRRLRRQERSVQPRDRRREGGAASSTGRSRSA